MKMDNTKYLSGKSAVRVSQMQNITSAKSKPLLVFMKIACYVLMNIKPLCVQPLGMKLNSKTFYNNYLKYLSCLLI